MAGFTAGLFGASAWADRFTDTAQLFSDAGRAADYFGKSYGYAVFPTIGKGGFIIGAAHGEGRVFVAGDPVGETSMTQVTLGFQAGGQAYSQIIFFQDARAFQEFSQGNFEFGGQVNAMVVTANAQAGAGTIGANAGASGGRKDATNTGGYYRGFAVFIIAKGGLMLEASIGGQKFSYEPLNQALDPDLEQDLTQGPE